MKKTIKQLEADLKSAKSEIEDYHNTTVRRREEASRLEQTIKQYQGFRLSLYQSLIQERMDLEARMLRIDQRIRICGYAAPGDPTGPGANRP